jgi:hypothetical protein
MESYFNPKSPPTTDTQPTTTSPSSSQPLSQNRYYLTGRHCLKWFEGNADIIYDNPSKSKLANVTIYCIHGTADKTSSFKTIAEGILPHLPSNIKSIHIASFNKRAQGMGIQEFVNQLILKILQNKDTNVILMGHSRGGLVASLVALHLTKKTNIQVQAVYALGSPYGGSDKTLPPFTWISESVAQMHKGSPFLANLIAELQQSFIPHYFYASEHDELVPLTSTYIPGKEENLIVVRNHSHLSMVASNELIQHLRKRIAGEDCSLSLRTLQNELQCYMTVFSQSWRLFSGDFKLKLMQSLNKFITDLIQNNKSRYPEASTISEFVGAFLRDTTLLHPNDPVYKALNIPLNLPQYSSTSTAIFFDSLCIRYTNINLLPKQDEELRFTIRCP